MLPHVSGRFELLRDVLHQIPSQLDVNRGGVLSLRSVDCGVVLQRVQRHVVDVDPDGAAPVRRIVLRVVPFVQRRRARQRAQPERRPQQRGVAQVGQYARQLRGGRLDQLEEKREQADVAERRVDEAEHRGVADDAFRLARRGRGLVGLAGRRGGADQRDVVGVESVVGVALGRVGPVQRVQTVVVGEEAVQLAVVAVGRSDRRGDVGHDGGGDGEPAAQVDVSLIRRRVARARVVIEPGRERLRVQLVDGGGVPPPPPVRPGQRARLRAIQPREPRVEARVEPHQIRAVGGVGAGGERRNEFCEGEEERRGVGDVGVLDEERGRDLRPCLRPEDLLARQPAALAQQVEPVRDDVERDARVPPRDQQQVEALVPEEATREERPRWHGGVERRRPRLLRAVPRRAPRLDQRRPVEVPHPPEQIAEGARREAEVLGVSARDDRERSREPRAELVHVRREAAPVGGAGERRQAARRSAARLEDDFERERQHCCHLEDEQRGGVGGGGRARQAAVHPVAATRLPRVAPHARLHRLLEPVQARRHRRRQEVVPRGAAPAPLPRVGRLQSQLKLAQLVGGAGDAVQPAAVRVRHQSALAVERHVEEERDDRVRLVRLKRSEQT